MPLSLTLYFKLHINYTLLYIIHISTYVQTCLLNKYFQPVITVCALMQRQLVTNIDPYYTTSFFIHTLFIRVVAKYKDDCFFSFFTNAYWYVLCSLYTNGIK